jgi:hypothetical protein
MDLQLSSPSSSELDSRVIAGWDALEHGDIEEARAALQDVHSVNPTHPALPSLAAGIRRARPKPRPWRGMVLMLGLLAAGAFAYASVRPRTVPDFGPTTVGEVAPPREVAPSQEEQPTPPVASASRTTIGTAGRSGPVRATTPSPQAAGTAPSDEAQIRQAISRFATTYSNRWLPLTFPSCDINRSEDTATVSCQSRTTQGSAAGAGAGTWLFTCRKVDGSWSIVSLQPAADLPLE